MDPYHHVGHCTAGAKNKAISAAVSKVVEEKLGVPASRFYIQFNVRLAKQWAVGREVGYCQSMHMHWQLG